MKNGNGKNGQKSLKKFFSDFHKDPLVYGNRSTQDPKWLIFSWTVILMLVSRRVKPKEDAIIMHNAPHWNDMPELSILV